MTIAFDYLNKIFIFAALFLKSCARHGTGYKDMKKLILIITLLFVVCNVNAGFLNPHYYIVHGEISIDRRWGGNEGQEITLTFFRMGGLILSVECKELGFRYEFEDSQDRFFKGRFLEDNYLCKTTDGKQVNSKNCTLKLGNFFFNLQRPLSKIRVKPSLFFLINKSNDEPDLEIDISFVEYKNGETVERQNPWLVTVKEDWLYQMFKDYDKVEKDIPDGEPELEIRPSYE